MRGTKELVFEDIDSELLHGTLERLEELWQRKKGLFEPGFKMAMSKVGRRDDFQVGVFVFYAVQGRVMVALSEYSAETRNGVVQISVMELGQWTGWKNLIKIEEKVGECVDEEIGAGQIPAPYGGRFICPECDAVYAFDNLEMSADGRVRCQHCGRWVDWLEAMQESGANPNDS